MKGKWDGTNSSDFWVSYSISHTAFCSLAIKLLIDYESALRHIEAESRWRTGLATLGNGPCGGIRNVNTNQTKGQVTCPGCNREVLSEKISSSQA